VVMRSLMRKFPGLGRHAGDPCARRRRASSTCTPAEAAEGPLGSLGEIVADYICRVRPARDRERAFYTGQPSLGDAIVAAAMCEREDGKRHSHQRRIPRRSLEAARDPLIARSVEIDACRSFEALHGLVERAIDEIERFPMRVSETGATPVSNP